MNFEDMTFDDFIRLTHWTDDSASDETYDDADDPADDAENDDSPPTM